MRQVNLSSLEQYDIVPESFYKLCKRAVSNFVMQSTRPEDYPVLQLWRKTVGIPVHHLFRC